MKKVEEYVLTKEEFNTSICKLDDVIKGINFIANKLEDDFISFESKRAILFNCINDLQLIQNMFESVQ